jgi:hypothetical protein
MILNSYKLMKKNIQLQLGTSIKPNKNYKDPSFENMDLTNWQGRVLQIKDGNISVEWDSITLNNFSDEYILALNEGGFDFFEYYLPIEDVDIVEPRDKPEDVIEANSTYRIFTTYTSFFEENARFIFELLKKANIFDDDEMLDSWFDYFANDFKFPQTGFLTDVDFNSRFKEGDSVKLIDINEHSDNQYGILVDCKHEKGKVTIPLCDIELDSEDEESMILFCYSTWFVNK